MIEEKLDGEEIRDIILNRPSPKYLSAKEILREMVHYTVLLFTPNLTRPDRAVVKGAVKRRINQLKTEINHRYT